MNISRKVKKQGIVVIVFLLILVHLMMRAAYDIENSLGDDETLGGRICSALLRHGIQVVDPYMLYASGSDHNSITGIRSHFLKNMPLEMCLLLEAEKDNHVTEYRQPSVIEEMAAIENSLAYQNIWEMRLRQRVTVKIGSMARNNRK